MERKLLDELLKWKESSVRKPMIIKGARQVGKTWLMKEFGKRHYQELAYVNFERSTHLRDLFKSDFDVNRILRVLQIETGIIIKKGRTLIILDEIQEAEGGLTALKYFCEDAPGYHLIAAGSLLGVALQEGASFPVGKVAFMELYPMSFSEYMQAVGADSLAELIEKNDWEMLHPFRDRLREYLRIYYFTGGMPEVVASYSARKDLLEVRNLQKSILLAYENDFVRHAPRNIVPRIRMLWNSIPGQLARENRKFLYRIVKEGARAKDYELALSWLEDCGLVHRIHRVNKPGMPLKAYEDLSAFKLFVVDTGLLGAMADLDAKSIIEGNSIFEEFKGALSEQYVLQQIRTLGLPVFYWSSERAIAEIDFLVQSGEHVFPIEVKAEENLKAKSLGVYREKFAPSLSIRTSLSDYREEGWLCNLPLYAIDQLEKVSASILS